MAVPILGRLNLRDYQALFIGWLLLFVEAILRLVTFCLPLSVLEICKTQSQRCDLVTTLKNIPFANLLHEGIS